MSNHTPRPWVARIAIRDGWVIFADDGQIVGTEDEYGRHGAIKKKEDAHLIAAAPELLEALEMLAAVDFGADGSVERGARMARIAIAKARGELT